MSQIISQTNSADSPEALFETLHLDNFRPAEFCLALLLGLASSWWRQHWRGAAKLLDAVRGLHYQLAHDPILTELQGNTAKLTMAPLLPEAPSSGEPIA
jgi:hypothetical protein